MPHPTPVPSEIVRKWQEIVDLTAEIMHVPSALIMRVEPPNIKVFLSSETKGNPYEPDEAAPLNTGLYCETVMKTRQLLLVPDALRDEHWQSNPDIKPGMISYLGVPIVWPDGEVFGTICVLDKNQTNIARFTANSCCSGATCCRLTCGHWQHSTGSSKSAKRRSGAWSMPISSGSSFGGWKVRFLRPTMRFSTCSDTTVRISRHVACTGRA